MRRSVRPSCSEMRPSNYTRQRITVSPVPLSSVRSKNWSGPALWKSLMIPWAAECREAWQEAVFPKSLSCQVPHASGSGETSTRRAVCSRVPSRCPETALTTGKWKRKKNKTERKKVRESTSAVLSCLAVFVTVRKDCIWVCSRKEMPNPSSAHC